MARQGAVTFKGNPLTLAGEAVKVGQPAPDFTLHAFEGGAMKTMGLTQLVLVQPRHFPHPEAQAMASRATDILDGAQVCATLDEALAGTVYAAACTARGRDLSHAVLSPRDPERAEALRAQLSRVEVVLGRGGVVEWMRGGNLEYAWQTIHSVERAMVALRSADELTGLLPAYRSAAAQVLPADDKVLTDLDPSAGAPSEALLRARVQALLLRYHSASDEFHESARRLRATRS